MVEQGTHKPLDVGSNPTLATVSRIFGVLALIALSHLWYAGEQNKGQKP